MAKAARPTTTPKKHHEEFAERIIAMLEKGMAPWQTPWKAGELHPPFNPVSGIVYSGINRVMLSKPDYADPRWMTFKQASSQGYRVKKGSKSQRVVHWQWTDSVDKLDEHGRPVLDANGEPEKETVNLVRPRVKFYSVFHAGQLETENGQPIPPFEPKKLEWKPNERAEAILEASGAVIIHDQRDRGFYSIHKDEIHLPPKESFAHEGDYYPIAFHELGHWTRHPSRLNRENGPFGSEMYAREELRVHIASWMMSQDLGIAFNPDQHHASYVQSWVKVLKDEPYEIMRACSDAERIKRYVMSLDRKQEKTAEIIFSELENDGEDHPAIGQAAMSAGTASKDGSENQAERLSKTIEQITRQIVTAKNQQEARLALTKALVLSRNAMDSPDFNALGAEVESAIITRINRLGSLHTYSREAFWLVQTASSAIVALGNIQANRLESDERAQNQAFLENMLDNFKPGPKQFEFLAGLLTDFKKDWDPDGRDWCHDRHMGDVLCRDSSDQPWRKPSKEENALQHANGSQFDLLPVIRLADGQVMTYDGQLHGHSLIQEDQKEVDTETFIRYLSTSATRIASAMEKKGQSQSYYETLLREIVNEGRDIMSGPGFNSAAHTQNAALVKYIVENLAPIMEPDVSIPSESIPFMLNDVLMMGHINAKLMSDHGLAGKLKKSIKANILERFANDPEKAKSLIPRMTGLEVRFDHDLPSKRLWCRRLNDGAALYKNHEHDFWEKDSDGSKLKEDFPDNGFPPITPILEIDRNSFLTIDGGLYSVDPEKKNALDGSDLEADISRRTEYVNGVLDFLVRPNLLTVKDITFKSLIGGVQEVRKADFNQGDASFNAFLDTIEKIGQRELAASATDPDFSLTLAQIENRVANSVLEIIAASRQLDYRGLGYAANELPGPKYRVTPLLPVAEGERAADLHHRGQALRGLREARDGEAPRVFAVAHENGNEVIAGFEDRNNAEGFAKALNGREIEFIKTESAVKTEPEHKSGFVRVYEEKNPEKPDKPSRYLMFAFDRSGKPFHGVMLDHNLPPNAVRQLFISMKLYVDAVGKGDSQQTLDSIMDRKAIRTWYDDEAVKILADTEKDAANSLLVLDEKGLKPENMTPMGQNWFIRDGMDQNPGDFGPRERRRGATLDEFNRLIPLLGDKDRAKGAKDEIHFLAIDSRNMISRDKHFSEMIESIIGAGLERKIPAYQRLVRDAVSTYETHINAVGKTSEKKDSVPVPEPANEKVYLQVPYIEKNHAKKAGAKWDKENKLWFAPVGADLAKLAQWMPEKEPAPDPAVSPVEEFRRLLESNGFILKGDPVMDGKIHRVAIEGKPGQRDGAYLAYSDGVPNGWFENHRDGDGKVTKWVYSGQQLSSEQRKLMQAEIDQRLEKAQKERERQYAKAAKQASEKFVTTSRNPVDPMHPYLKAKGVGNHGLHQDDNGNLLVFGLNLYKTDFMSRRSQEGGQIPDPEDLTVSRFIQTVQTISPDGEKRFEPGSQKKGAVHIIGETALKKIAYDQRYGQGSLFSDLYDKPEPEILIAEGYATGASLYEATKMPVVVAFDAGNLLPAAKALRSKFPDTRITICADNDHPLVRQKIQAEQVDVKVTPQLEEKYASHNKGLVKAMEAAKAIKAKVLVPQFTEEEKAKNLTDFNDLAQSRGKVAVAQIVSTRHRSQTLSTDMRHMADNPPQGFGLAM